MPVPHRLVGGETGWLGWIEWLRPGHGVRAKSAGAFIVHSCHRAALVSLGGHGWGGGSALGQQPIRPHLEKSGRTVLRPWPEAMSNERRWQRWKLARQADGDWKTSVKSDGHYLR